MPEMIFSQLEPSKKENKIFKKEDEAGVTLNLEFDAESGLNQDLRRVAKMIKGFVGNPENYMDQGGAGRVYAFGKMYDVCVKIVANRHDQSNSQQYNLGNNIHQEANFLKTLTDFSVSGVRSPQYIEVLRGQRYGAIVMEKLNAVNLQHVINNTEQLPESFEKEVFFNAIDEYIASLHSEKEICHMDLEPRNIMVDKITGNPFIIDFGRSVSLKGLSPQKRRQYEDDDLDKLAAGEKAFSDAIDKVSNKC